MLKVEVNVFEKSWTKWFRNILISCGKFCSFESCYQVLGFEFLVTMIYFITMSVNLLRYIL